MQQCIELVESITFIRWPYLHELCYQAALSASISDHQPSIFSWKVGFQVCPSLGHLIRHLGSISGIQLLDWLSNKYAGTNPRWSNLHWKTDILWPKFSPSRDVYVSCWLGSTAAECLARCFLDFGRKCAVSQGWHWRDTQWWFCGKIISTSQPDKPVRTQAWACEATFSCLWKGA